MRWFRYLLILSMLCVLPAHAIMVKVISGSSSGLTPPTYYASAILSMNFEEGLNAFDVSGNAVLFTDSGSDIGAYGHTGQGMKVDDAGEDITFTQTAQQYFDEGGAQTLCMKTKVSAATYLDNTVTLFDFTDGDDDYIQMRISVDNTAKNYVYYVQGGTVDYEGGTNIDHNTWEVVGITWQDAGTNGDIAANPGDNATWGDGWDDDVDKVDSTMTTTPTSISIGSSTGDPGDTEIIYIDEWALVNTYKFDCSTLFSPE